MATPPPHRPTHLAAPALLKRSGRVLLAEDDDAARSVFADTLRGHGYIVVEAGNGADLIDRFCEAAADIVVTDICMPSLSGLEALFALRLGRFHVPVIVMTAFGSNEIHRAAARLGAAAVIDKPFGIRELLRTVHDVLADELKH